MKLFKIKQMTKTIGKTVSIMEDTMGIYSEGMLYIATRYVREANEERKGYSRINLVPLKVPKYLTEAFNQEKANISLKDEYVTDKNKTIDIVYTMTIEK